MKEKLTKIFESKNLFGNVSYKTIEDVGDYICIFDSCEKKFKNFCHWRLYYFSHVIIFICLFIFQTNCRPYQCVICKKRFTEKGNLNFHLRTHASNRIFSCDKNGCRSMFKTKGNLKRHLIIHDEKEKIRWKKFLTRNEIVTESVEKIIN